MVDSTPNTLSRGRTGRKYLSTQQKIHDGRAKAFEFPSCHIRHFRQHTKIYLSLRKEQEEIFSQNAMEDQVYRALASTLGVSHGKESENLWPPGGSRSHTDCPSHLDSQ